MGVLLSAAYLPFINNETLGWSSVVVLASQVKGSDLNLSFTFSLLLLLNGLVY